MTHDSSITFASAGPRGCGKARQAGGVYLETGFSEYGAELEEFLIDPVVQINPYEIGLSPRAPLLFQSNTSANSYHVFDWVGAEHYPNAVDFLEEVRRMGLSRRCELSDREYNLLSPESRIMVVMADTWIEPDAIIRCNQRFLDMRKVGYRWEKCPQEFHFRDTPDTCAGWHWHTIRGKVTSHPDYSPFLDTEYVTREMPWGSYNGATPFPELDAAMKKPGVIACFPIGRIAVVKDNEDNTHKGKIRRLKNCSLRVDLVEE